MKKFSIIFVSFVLLIMLASCYSTTFVDEGKMYSFIPGKGNSSTIKLIDNTQYAVGNSSKGDDYYCYYTKSQKYYDMFEFGVVNKLAKEQRAAEPSLEFYCGDYDTDTWKLLGKWDEVSSNNLSSETLPLIFIKPNKKSYLAGSSNGNEPFDVVSGRIYVKQFYGDYKVVYTTEYGEEICSYFKLVK